MACSPSRSVPVALKKRPLKLLRHGSVGQRFHRLARPALGQRPQGRCILEKLRQRPVRVTHAGRPATPGEQSRGLATVPPILVILLTCMPIPFLTELTSNTATTQMILPILASVATAIHVNPLMLMIPATLAASQAFMMPVATPPNAIIFGSQRVQIREMARAGFLINIIGVLIITLVFSLLGPVIFHIESGALPVWALPQ